MLLSKAVVLVALAGTSTADLASKRFRQDRFFISYWVGPQVPIPELDERFAEIAAANFTGHLGFNGNGNSHGLYNDSDIHPTKERVPGRRDRTVRQVRSGLHPHAVRQGRRAGGRAARRVPAPGRELS